VCVYLYVYEFVFVLVSSYYLVYLQADILQCTTGNIAEILLLIAHISQLQLSLLYICYDTSKYFSFNTFEFKLLCGGLSEQLSP